jgi:WD40 repeat protein
MSLLTPRQLSAAAALACLLVLPRPAAAADPPAPAPRLDAYGDPLPDGAIARLGTARFAHGRGVGHAVWSADGKVLVTSPAASDDGIAFWDVATGKALRRVNPGPGRPGFALSSDGKRLAWPGTALRVLDATSGKLLFECAEGLRPFNVGFSPDGKTLATLGWRGSPEKQTEEVVLCDGTTGKELHRLASEALTFGFSPDSKTLAVGTAGGGIALIDPTTGKQTRTWQAHAHDTRVCSFAFSPDGRTLASGCGTDGTIGLWDVQTGKELRRCSGLRREVVYLAFTPNGKTLVSGLWGNTARVWDVETGKELRQFGVDQGSGAACALSPDGNTLALGSYLRLWDVKTGKEVDPRPTVFGQLAFSPDGKSLVSVAPTLQVWEGATGKRRHELAGGAGGQSRPAFSPDGKKVAMAMDGGTLRVWDPTTGKELYRAAGKSYGGTVAFSADGKTLWYADERAAAAHDAATGAELRQAPLARDPFSRLRGSVQISPDGRLVAGALDDSNPRDRGEGGVRLWDRATGKVVRSLGGEAGGRHGSYGAIAFSPDGKVLAATENGSRIGLWDVDGAKELRRWEVPSASIATLAFSEDGGWLASAGWAGPTRIWEVATGKLAYELPRRDGWALDLAFSPDGRLLATSGTDGAALVWDLSSQAARLGKPMAKELPALWDDLKADDARRAYQAASRLAGSAEGVTFLAKRLGTGAPAADAKQVAKLIADLDAEDFDVREAAAKELAKLGHAAAPALKAVLQGRPSAEAKRRAEELLAKLESVAWPPERLLARRAVSALERAGTADARRALRELAKGSGHAADFAAAAVRRLAASGEKD